jgi:hypothetical protein
MELLDPPVYGCRRHPKFRLLVAHVYLIESHDGTPSHLRKTYRCTGGCRFVREVERAPSRVERDAWMQLAMYSRNITREVLPAPRVSIVGMATIERTIVGWFRFLREFYEPHEHEALRVRLDVMSLDEIEATFAPGGRFAAETLPRLS